MAVDASELKSAILADPELSAALRFDELASLWYVRGELLCDAIRAELQIDLKRRLNLRCSKHVFQEALDALEREEGFNFHPIRDYLDSLEWDGTDRLSTLFENLFNSAMERPYLAAVARNFFVSLVARAYQPGCKVDTMLILEGMQGIGKSRALRAIGGAWYREHKTQELGGKDMLSALKGCWIYDINELRGFATTDRRIIKSMLSSQEDFYRLPYRRDAAVHPRNCVIVGSTNDDLYLSDETGNRRFWPIKCGYIVEVDLLERSRDQLFAEAVMLYRAGEPWWEMPDDVHNLILQARAYINPYFDRVREYVGDTRWLKRYVPDKNRFQKPQVFCYVFLDDVMSHLKLQRTYYGDANSRQIAKCLRALGFESNQARPVALGIESPQEQVTIYRKHMGPAAFVNLLPEEKPVPILHIVPKKAAP